jgi:hypothetical protein
MKFKSLLPALALLIVTTTTGQKKKSLAFAITSEKQGGAVWTELKLIDLETGEVIQNVFESKLNKYRVLHARNGTGINIKDAQGTVTDFRNMPFSGAVAALAFDRKHNRLYYTPMYVNQLRYIDLNEKEPAFYYFTDEEFAAVKDITVEANHITRMVIASDGSGYALNNNSTHLIKFTTGRKPVITDLGSVEDDPANGEVSIRDRLKSWGGDMIADASGNLYLLSANRSVFKIDVNRRIATFITSLEGLPGNFTTNGAVIDGEGNLIVSSANSIAGYYKIDMKNWKATLIPSQGKVFNTSDLANGNLAFDKERPDLPTLMTRSLVANDKIDIYPNPVTQNQMTITFDNSQAGLYNIQLLDISGKTAVQQEVTIGMRGQIATVELDPRLARGLYMVKVLNKNKKTLYSGKIFID